MKNQKMENPNSQESINKNRRKLLAVMLIGSGTFLVQKVLSPLFSGFLNDSPAKIAPPPDKTDFGNFKVVENKKSLSIYDNSGEEVFQIDKEG